MSKEYDISKSPFEWDQLDIYLQYKASLTVCAEMLGVHENTIKNHIKARFDQTFTQYAERKLSRTRIKLVEKAISMALNGDRTMLIFCLKNINDWTDRKEVIDIKGMDDRELIDKARSVINTIEAA